MISLHHALFRENQPGLQLRGTSWDTEEIMSERVFLFLIDLQQTYIQIYRAILYRNLSPAIVYNYNSIRIGNPLSIRMWMTSSCETWLLASLSLSALFPSYARHHAAKAYICNTTPQAGSSGLMDPSLLTSRWNWVGRTLVNTSTNLSIVRT